MDGFMIYDLDEKESFENLKYQYQQVKNLLILRSENREVLRKACCRIFKIDYEDLDNCISSFEQSLLISCYTLSEQLLKNFIYQLLTKDSNSNTHVDKFINIKLDINKFSPNPKFCEIKKELNSFLKYDFYLSQKNPLIKSYDEMIDSRHSYAHANSYIYNFKSFPEVIEALEYLIFEYNLFLNHYESKGKNIVYWKNFSESLGKIKRLDDCVKDTTRVKCNYIELLQNMILFRDDCDQSEINFQSISYFDKIFPSIAELLENQDDKAKSYQVIKKLKSTIVF